MIIRRAAEADLPVIIALLNDDAMRTASAVALESKASRMRPFFIRQHGQALLVRIAVVVDLPQEAGFRCRQCFEAHCDPAMLLL